MLLKRLLGLLATASMLGLCRSQCHIVSSDLNTKWRGADVLERYARNYYHSLAIRPDDNCYSRKRFVSVYSEALFQYMNNNITDKVASIRDAVAKTKRQLDQPADVIGAPFKSLMSYYLSFIDQPLTDVQATCPYNVREAQCNVALHKLQTERVKSCPGYYWNVDLYSTLVFFVTRCGFQNLYQDLMRASYRGGDTEALDFFTDAASMKYSNVIHFIKDIWKESHNMTFTCNSLSFM